MLHIYFLQIFFLCILFIVSNKEFFQAEDGIRDPEMSRGLGDVYKRQLLNQLLREVKPEQQQKLFADLILLVCLRTMMLWKEKLKELEKMIVVCSRQMQHLNQYLSLIHI